MVYLDRYSLIVFLRFESSIQSERIKKQKNEKKNLKALETNNTRKKKPRERPTTISIIDGLGGNFQSLWR